MVVLYDWAITLSLEVELFWTGKVQLLSAILYFANKYLNVLAPIGTMLQLAPWPEKV